MRWNDCILIYTDKTLDKEISASAKQSFYKYMEEIKQLPKYNVWYDEASDRCFGIDQTYKNRDVYALNNTLMAAVLTPPDIFLEDKQHGYKSIAPVYTSLYTDDVSLDKEGVIGRPSALQHFVGSKILIVGAGPSTDLVDWDQYPYDYLWSCNHFFKHPELAQKDIALVNLGNEVSLYDKELNEYLFNHPKTISVFDGRINRHPEHLQDFNKRYPHRSTFYHPRYFGRVGTVTRLICLAVSLKATEVAFVGMDGYPKDLSSAPNSVFEPQKAPGGANHGPTEYNFFRMQYTVFWDYVLNYWQPTTKFQNLGENYKNNLTADISKQHFPLEKFYDHRS
jgi:hypothetical protein